MRVRSEGSCILIKYEMMCKIVCPSKNNLNLIRHFVQVYSKYSTNLPSFILTDRMLL